MINRTLREERAARLKILVAALDAITRRSEELSREHDAADVLSVEQAWKVAERVASMTQNNLAQAYAGLVLRVYGQATSSYTWLEKTPPSASDDLEMADAVDRLNMGIYELDELALKYRTVRLFGGRLPEHWGRFERCWMVLDCFALLIHPAKSYEDFRRNTGHTDESHDGLTYTQLLDWTRALLKGSAENRYGPREAQTSARNGT